MNLKDTMTLNNYRICRSILLDLIAERHRSCSEEGMRRRRQYQEALAKLRTATIVA